MVDIDPNAFRPQEALHDDRKHDELLRMRCIEAAIAVIRASREYGREPPLLKAEATLMYREVTGRDWPTWGPSPEDVAREIAATQCPPGTIMGDPERRVPRHDDPKPEPALCPVCGCPSDKSKPETDPGGLVMMTARMIRKSKMTRNGLNHGDLDVAWQLFRSGMVWDGNLSSKESRDHLVRNGYAVRHDGMQALTGKGIVSFLLTPAIWFCALRRWRNWGKNPFVTDAAGIRRAMN